MDQAKPILKYLFLAEFEDGSFLQQTQDDVSSLLEKKSQFYDVLNHGSKLTTFTLTSTDGTNSFGVDLRTGLFYVNGIPLLLESEKLPGLPDKFKLIFYRQWTRSIDMTYKTKTGEEVSGIEQEPFCEYFIGWECEVGGKSYKQKLAMS